MGIRERMRTSTAVYWAPGSALPDGTIKFENPIEIKTRWEDEYKEFAGVNGIIHSFHHLMPDRMLAVGGMVLKGKLESLTTPLDPFECKAKRIIEVANTPNVRGTKQLPEAWC